MVRQLSGSSVEDRGDYVVVRTDSNPTFYWGNFLLFPEPPRAGDPERWLARFAAEFPVAGHVAIGVDGVDGERGDDGAFGTAGLEPDVGVVLTTDRVLPPFRSDP